MTAVQVKSHNGNSQLPVIIKGAEQLIVEFKSAGIVAYHLCLCYNNYYVQLVRDEVKQFNLIMKPCPPGHLLHVTDSNDEYECKCDKNNVNIVECAPNETKIILEVCNTTQQLYKCTVSTTMRSQEGLWAHYVNNGSVDSMLEYYHCPPGYCQCRRLDESSEKCSSVYSYSDENFQCVCDREGTQLQL